MSALDSPAPQPDDTATIEFGFSSYFASDVTVLRADGRVVRQTRSDGSDAATVTRNAPPGAFDRATALIAARGLATVAALGPPQVVLDYGTDFVVATPPIAGFSEVRAVNVDPALQALLADLRAAIGDRE